MIERWFISVGQFKWTSEKNSNNYLKIKYKYNQ